MLVKPPSPAVGKPHWPRLVHGPLCSLLTDSPRWCSYVVQACFKPGVRLPGAGLCLLPGRGDTWPLLPVRPSRVGSMAADLAGKDPQFFASAGTPRECTAACRHASHLQNLPCLLQCLICSPRVKCQVKTEQPAIPSSLKSG